MMLPSIFRDGLFDDFMDFAPMSGQNKENTLMKTDAKETEQGYELEMDLPGFKKEDVTCELKDGYLTISAQKKVENDEKNDEGKYIRRERYTGSQSRSFFVGEHLTEEDIHASFEDGILKLSIPKEEVKPVEEKRHFVQIEG